MSTVQIEISGSAKSGKTSVLQVVAKALREAGCAVVVQENDSQLRQDVSLGHLDVALSEVLV